MPAASMASATQVERHKAANDALEPLNDVLATFGIFSYGKASLLHQRISTGRHARLLYCLIACILVSYGMFLAKEAIKGKIKFPIWQEAVDPDNQCWAIGKQPSKCSFENERMEIFMWNLTNPIDTRAGVEPVIVERGPYVLVPTTITAASMFTQKKFTQVFSKFYTIDNEMTHSACGVCDADRDQIIGPNLPWLSYLQVLGGSEVPMLWRWAPHSVLYVIDSIEQTLRNGITTAFTNEDFSDGFRAAALEQWALCTISSVPISVFAIPPRLPDRPEICTFEQVTANARSVFQHANETSAFLQSMRHLSSSSDHAGAYKFQDCFSWCWKGIKSFYKKSIALAIYRTDTIACRGKYITRDG